MSNPIISKIIASIITTLLGALVGWLISMLHRLPPTTLPSTTFLMAVGDPLPDGETWSDYQHNILAVIPSQSSDTVTISDIGTGIGRTITADQLRQVSRIITTKG